MTARGPGATVRRLVASVAAALLLWAGAVPAMAQDAPPPANMPAVVTIPKIGLEAPVVSVGLEEDGAMAAPTDPDTVGWYELGPGLGVPGNAILAGHVDWGGRLRTFGQLRRLEPGDMVSVTDLSGAAYRYRVTWTQLFDADTAPVEEVFAQSMEQEVTLITCGGVFDPATRQYLGRLVVRAVREAAAGSDPMAF